MSAFKDGSFAQRFEQMGDQAEGVFEEVYPEGFARFGLNRPPIHLASVPPFIRYMPDYLTQRGLVEVQGFGRDQTAKFKVDKLDALTEWHRHFRVDFFLWDSHKKRHGWVRFPELDDDLFRISELRSFPEGNQYFAIKADDLPVVAWIPHGDQIKARR